MQTNHPRLRQLGSQPSPSLVFPSSHSSGSSSLPSPQTIGWPSTGGFSVQSAAQKPSLELPSPSSHASPKSLIPLPQRSRRQTSVQPLPAAFRSPLSHSSL